MITSGNIQAQFRDYASYDIWQLVDSGAPTAATGAGLAGPCSTYCDITNKKVYVNKGTKATPDWKEVTTA